MTIYCQHANRGKTQILATYHGPAGITSTTVTSVADTVLATPIVDALNRISALATVPVSVYDMRGNRQHYPRTHLAAFTQREVRADLLCGTHSLWYEYACVLLHTALTDLDGALAATPEPVRIAVQAEVDTEVRSLIAELDVYHGGGDDDDQEAEQWREWGMGTPFVQYPHRDDPLSGETRELLDRREKGATPQQRESAIADLRTLVSVCERSQTLRAISAVTSARSCSSRTTLTGIF